jgi:hypothetical protein
MLAHPTLEQLSAMGLHGMAKPLTNSPNARTPRASRTANGLRFCLNAKPPIDTTGVWRLACATRGCGTWRRPKT